MDWWEPWYRRDRGGRWRYRLDGTFVPGARDLRMEGLWRPITVNAAWVEFPGDIIRAWPEFAWAQRWWLAAPPDTPTPRHADGAVISKEEWDLHRDRLIGLTAPELNPATMLSTNAVAALLRVHPKTLTAYVSRGEFPAPTINRGRHPLWSVPVLARHLAVTRAERSERERRAETRRSASRRHHAASSGTSGRLVLSELDSLLEQLGVDLDFDDDLDDD